MKYRKIIVTFALTVVMLFALNMIVFATTFSNENQLISKKDVIPESTIKPLTVDIKQDETEIFLTSDDPVDFMPLHLDEYSGNVKKLFVLAQGENSATVNLSLIYVYDEAIWDGWTMTGNEYTLFTVENALPGNYLLIAEATGLEGPDQYVQIKARWQ